MRFDGANLLPFGTLAALGDGAQTLFALFAAGTRSAGRLFVGGGIEGSLDTEVSASAGYLLSLSYTADGAPMPLIRARPRRVVRGLWGSSERDVWAVGGSRTATGSLEPQILHWNGSQWAYVSAPPGAYILSAVWGRAPDDIWAVGGVPNRGTTPGSVAVLRIDGSSWRSVELPAPVPIYATAVTGSGSTDVWIALTGTSNVLRFDGATRNALDTGNGGGLTGLASIGSDLWGVGFGGSIQRRQGP